MSTQLGAHLEEVLVHARGPGGVVGVDAVHPHVVQGIGHPWVLLPKGQVVHRVAGVKLGGLEGHQVVHVHVALLERPPRRKVEVARHLLNVHVHLQGSGLGVDCVLCVQAICLPAAPRLTGVLPKRSANDGWPGSTRGPASLTRLSALRLAAQHHTQERPSTAEGQCS